MSFRMNGKAESPVYEEITKEHLIDDLKTLGVKKGDLLAVGASFKSIGNVKEGPDAVIDALIEAVGDDGTIMFNTYTRKFQLSDIRAGKIDYVFDHRYTPAITGILPETFRKRKNSIRSTHPTNSISALGNYAKYLTECHNPKSHAYFPYSKLAEKNGKMLCIGIGDNIVGLRHEAQYLAGLLTKIPFEIGVKYYDETSIQQLFIRDDPAGCIAKLPLLVPPLREKGIVRDGNIGNAHSIIIRAKEALEEMTTALKENTVEYLCDDFFCLWCRELEKRMNLYNLISSKKTFQKNSILRVLLSIINNLRLRNNKVAIKLLKIFSY